MTIIIIEKLKDSLTIDQDGIRKFIPRNQVNEQYSQIIGMNYQEIDRDGVNYKAFPFSNIINGYYVAIYSDGDAHAQSDRQYMTRKKISDIELQTVEWESAVFYEVAGDVYNFSLLDDIMNDGDSFVFKVWTLTKTAGVISQTVTSSIVVSGNADPDLNGSYALWSKSRLYAGNYYRTGYMTDASGWNCALFESSDQSTWIWKASICKGFGSGEQFNEADIAETTPGNYIAVIREDSGAGRPVYTSTSADLITWTAPVLSESLTGTQPNLLRLASGTILVALGDRVGSTGIDSGGFETLNKDRTGVSVFSSTDNGAAFDFGTLMDVSWSTDCGQPHMEEASADVITMMYYNALGPTDSVTEPGIVAKVFSEASVL